MFASPFTLETADNAKRKVNKSMSKVRISVEWSFGQQLQYWTILDFKRQQVLKVVPVVSWYKVAVFLTNYIAIMWGSNTNSEYFGLHPPAFDECISTLE